ncbi:LacI family DNA-binding transcriptional regulator [Sphingobacterium corticibacter]|uniref:LacI family transcriptional regulator n=1 Tax=Sphingobacterium corticibacter TaxID=2171749 RepID=A0A2T8HL10_9SPHI|nr:LacI family DNA-binding transcriptional regulator [Sphingobacterium corticibacter]PVH26131.1 LacI family transcriptional regulator [Sphingobacterium corticibacter]
MQTDKPATIKEIARKLKISTSTVSRALNNHPSIGLITTERVKQMAKELQYEPNQTAIFFKQRKTFTIGVIVPYLAEPFFADAIGSIEQYANEKDYTVILSQSFDDEMRELKIIQTFKRHRVDGVLISLSKSTTDFTFIDTLRQAKIPVVFFDRVPKRTDVHRVFSDLSTGMREAIEAFVNRGHQNIALINGPDTMIASQERLSSFQDAMKQHNLPLNKNYIVSTDLFADSNEQAMETLINLPDRPSAVIAFNDMVTLDVMRYLRTKGLVLNQDFFFISFANYPGWEYIDNPPMGSIEQYPRKQGLRAAEILFEAIEQKEVLAAQTVVFPSKLALT